MIGPDEAYEASFDDGPVKLLTAYIDAYLSFWAFHTDTIRVEVPEISTRTVDHLFAIYGSAGWNDIAFRSTQDDNEDWHYYLTFKAPSDDEEEDKK